MVTRRTVWWAVALAVVSFLVFDAASVSQAGGDTTWSVHEAYSVLTDRDIDLVEYEPLVQERQPPFYRVRVGRYLNGFPWGASIVNAPVVFSGFWAAISPFIDPKTKSKVSFCKSDAKFWAATEAQLRGDVTETAEGYDVVLRGADELDVSVEDNSLRVAGVIIPSPPVQDKILNLAKRRAMRYGHGRVTEEDVIAASKGRFGRVDELVRLPANADVERATRECRGRDVVVRVPRRAPPRRRVRRAVDPYYGRALFREPSYPPIYSY